VTSTNHQSRSRSSRQKRSALLSISILLFYLHIYLPTYLPTYLIKTYTSKAGGTREDQCDVWDRNGTTNGPTSW